MATLSDAIQNILREDLAPGIRDALTEQSNFFKMISNRHIGVFRSNIGRDWKVIHTYITSLAGSYKRVGDYTGDNVNVEGPPYTVHGTPRTFQGVSGHVSPGYVHQEITLHEDMGNIFIPHLFARADQLTASIGSAVAAILKQSARQVALIEAVHFFSPNPDEMSLMVADGSNGVNDGGDGDTTVTYLIDTAETRIANLQPGILVDVYSSGGTKLNVSQDVVVYSVDPINNLVRLDFADGSTTWNDGTNGTPSDSDYVTLKDSAGNGPNNLESWLKSSGAIPFGNNFTLANYPQFASVRKAVSGSLTDDVLTKYLTGFIQGHGAGWAPDTLITTEGVLNEYVYQHEGGFGGGIFRRERQGQATRVVGGFDEVQEFRLNGRSFNLMIDRLVAPQRLYAIKLRDNIVRYVPPKLPNSRSRENFQDIEFVAPLGGSRDIWKHAHFNSGTTEYLEAPYVRVQQYTPDSVFPGVVLTGLTERMATT